MNTTIVVWVMMSYAHGWIPTLEFKDRDRCEAAALTIKNNHDSRDSFSRIILPYCVRIEK